MVEVVNYISSSSYSPSLSPLFLFFFSFFRFLSCTASYCTRLSIVRKAFFLSSFFLSPSLLPVFSLSIVWLSFSLIGCFIINELVHCSAYIYNIGYVVVILVVVRDVKGVEDDEGRGREREIESIVHYSNVCICSFPYHHFALFLSFTFFCHTNTNKRPRQNASVLCRFILYISHPLYLEVRSSFINIK